MLLCAQFVIPVTAEPIEDGAVLVRDGAIVDVGQSASLRMRYGDEEVLDFGAAAILPGLIDLHTHLENSVLRGLVPDQPYVTWHQAVTELCSKLDADDWHASAVFGGLEALSSGITCVGDVSMTGASCSVLPALGMRGVVFRGIGAMDKRHVDDAVRALRSDIDHWGESLAGSLMGLGIAAREVFSCHPSIFKEAARIAREEDMPLSLYVATSREEYDFIRWGSSSLSIESMASKRGSTEAPPWLPAGVSPVNYLLNWGAFDAPNVIATHCVHVDGEDIRMMQKYDVAVALCPRCNAQLSMGVAPLLDFLRSDLRVGLGTGYTIATNSTDVLREMRIGLLLNRAINPGRYVAASTMLSMATIDAARVLRIDDEVGSIEVGKRADLCAIDLSQSRQVVSENPISVIVNSSTAADTLMTMVDGVVRYEKDNWNVDMDVARDIARVIEIRTKLRK